MAVVNKERSKVVIIGSRPASIETFTSFAARIFPPFRIRSGAVRRRQQENPATLRDSLGATNSRESEQRAATSLSPRLGN